LLGSNSWFNKTLTAMINSVLPADQALNSLPMMNSNFAVVLVMVYSYLPFMILPLYANLERLDLTLNEAATDLGSRPWQVFKDITLPLSVPGIIAGGLLVFIPASGELVIPSLVGNAADPMIGRIISDEFASARDWPMASAVAVALLMLLVVPIMAYAHFEKRAQDSAEGRA
jgi:putrescine transport system permease protein